MNLFTSILTGTLANIATALVSAILLIFNVTSVEGKQPTFSTDGYTLVFEDNFDGNELDTGKWRAHNSQGLRKGGYWSLDQVSLTDGNLRITTEYLEDGKFGSGWYTAGISTRDRFEATYGYYECRCILPKGQGLWSAFWLTNPNVSKEGVGSENGVEIDVFESPYYFLGDGNNYKVTSNLHYNGYELKTKYKNVGITALDNNPYENYNTYGMLWTEKGYTFYVNGVEVAFSDYKEISKANEYLILSCEVDGAAATPTYGWSGKITRNEDNFSTDFIVDYVRVYQETK